MFVKPCMEYFVFCFQFHPRQQSRPKLDHNLTGSKNFSSDPGSVEPGSGKEYLKSSVELLEATLTAIAVDHRWLKVHETVQSPIAALMLLPEPNNYPLRLEEDCKDTLYLDRLLMPVSLVDTNCVDP